MPANIICPKCKVTRNFMSRKEINCGWCSFCEQEIWSDEKKEETKNVFVNFMGWVKSK